MGTWFDFFMGKAGPLGNTWGPGRATFRYPNSQRPSTAWYHDHTLGMTRLNVYAGPAGFYLIRSDDPADNPTVAGNGGPAVLPGPAPQLGDEAWNEVLRDPDRHPGSFVRLRRGALLPRHSSVLRWFQWPVHP